MTAETPIYHITHVNNLAGIIAEDRIWCDSQRIRRGLTSINIGYQHIKERRRRRPVPIAAGGMLGNYVPFNFCFRSVMLYVINQNQIDDYDEGQDPVVHLVSSIDLAVNSGRSWAFTDRHAELGYAKYFSSLEHLDQIDWNVMPLKYWGGPGNDELKEKRQAEFLVHDWFPWEAIETITVKNKQIGDRVADALRLSDHEPNVVLDRTWYY